jgi:hypothetical protein
MRPTRRQFLSGAGGAMLLGGGMDFLSRLNPVSAAEAELHPSLVRLGDDIEPTVRLLEDTPRERVLEEVAAQIRKGLSYRQVLAALLLAGVRDVQPRPQVGFKFHAVLVINSAHLASLDSPESDRWLPIFWAIDRFKSAQDETSKTSGWRMAPVNEAKVPPPSKARQAFAAAMDNWDEEAADASAAALARSVPRDECFQLFAHYGCRDFRDIGHKAIYVSNSFRTLSAIGWQHAEPVLRSLAYALLQHEGASPATRDDPADLPGRRNAELLKKIRPEWADGKSSPQAVGHLLSVFRTGSAEDCPAAVVGALNDGISIQSIWDAILAASGELLMRKTNILTLHSVTSSNALRFAFETAESDETRLMLLLQNAAFIPLFRQSVGKMDSVELDQFAPADASEKHTVEEIFTTATHDRIAAARMALEYLGRTRSPRELIVAARRLVFLKGNDAHDYKFSSAVLEDYYNVSPQWRDRYLASSLFYLPASGAPDTPLVDRIRGAFGTNG